MARRRLIAHGLLERGVARPCLLDLVAYLMGQRRGGQDLGERPKAEDPAAKRPVVAHVERDDDAAVLSIGGALRRMPSPLADVRRDARLERNLDSLPAGPRSRRAVRERSLRHV